MSIVRLETTAPPPLAPLENEIVSPENIALEQLRRTATTLSFVQRLRLNAQRRRLERQLTRWPIVQRIDDVRDRMEILEIQHEAYKRAWQDQPSPELRQEIIEWREKHSREIRQLRALSHQYRQIEPQHKQYLEIQQALKQHEMAVEYRRAHEVERRRLRDESKIYEAIIIDRLTALGHCHRYERDGRSYVHEVSFNRVISTLDAHYYEIDASYRTLLGAWGTNLPQGVYVGKHVLAPETLDELTVACRRQVTGLHSQRGGWIIVNRHDSADGLLKFIEYGDVMQRYPQQYHSRVPVCVGVAAHRRVQWITLADHPHWLIGGYTLSGKSNLVNAIITTLITRHEPSELRMFLVDLKGGLEFSYYEGIPHLISMVTEIPAVVERLAQLESIMHQRFEQFRGVAKTFEQYKQRRPRDLMPRLIFVFDEVASIMAHGEQTTRILASLRELVRMGRAVGIHIILCTQRPDIQALDGAIKVNLAVRISGRMPTSSDSVTILGHGAAKTLEDIPGRMVMQLGPDPTVIQTPYLSPEALAEGIQYAMTLPPAPEIDLPSVGVVDQFWTVERVIDVALTHLDGNVNYRGIFEACEGLSRSQAQAIAQEIWDMPTIEHGGQQYKIKKIRNNRRLVPL